MDRSQCSSHRLFRGKAKMTHGVSATTMGGLGALAGRLQVVTAHYKMALARVLTYPRGHDTYR